MNDTNDLLKLIDLHRFHAVLQPRVCYLCKVEQFRSENSPVNRWGKAVRTLLHPPRPIAILLLLNLALTAAFLVTLTQVR